MDQPNHSDRGQPDTVPNASALAWALAGCALTLMVVGLLISVVVLVRSSSRSWNAPHLLLSPVTTIAYALVGALVAARHPRNPIGWMFSAVGVCSSLTFAAVSMSIASETGALFVPGGELARWLKNWVWIPVVTLPITFLLLLFPDGRLLSARWRLVAWAAGLGIVAFLIGIALHPRPPIEPDPAPNPFGLIGAASALNLLLAAAFPLLALGTFGSLAALVVRFRRADIVEREQLKWLAYAGGIALLGGVASGVLFALWPENRFIHELSITLSSAGGVVIAVAAGIAILRHRLYAIDVLINRTLVYGALSAGVVATYVLLVGTLSALFQSSGNLFIALLATGLVALFIQPLRARLQRRVNRLMYGERDDPYLVLSGLSQQLRTTLAPSAVLPSIAETIAQTLKLPYVALALAHGNRLEVAAAYGVPAADLVTLPLVYQTETVGQLLVASRAPGEAFTPTERRLLDDIALQAGVAAHAVRLTGDLQRSRERLVMAREEERRRLRRDLHDGLGPQLASLSLTVAAARELLLHDAAAADALLEQLAAHTQAATADIRRIVYDLRPPALDDLGLLLAVGEQAALLGQRSLRITVDAPDQLPPLPAAVEAATYRIVQEALTNVVRHARARVCTVRLTLNDGLDVVIEDDGIGMPTGGRSGVGLTSIRERSAELGGTCRLDTALNVGTRIHVWLPLKQDRI